MQIESISENKIEIQRLTSDNEKFNNEKNSALNEITQLKLKVTKLLSPIRFAPYLKYSLHM